MKIALSLAAALLMMAGATAWWLADQKGVAQQDSDLVSQPKSKPLGQKPITPRPLIEGTPVAEKIGQETDSPDPEEPDSLSLQQLQALVPELKIIEPGEEADLIDMEKDVRVTGEEEPLEAFEVTEEEFATDPIPLAKDPTGVESATPGPIEEAPQP